MLLVHGFGASFSHIIDDVIFDQLKSDLKLHSLLFVMGFNGFKIFLNYFHWSWCKFRGII